MTKRGVASLAIRLMGVYVLIQALPSVLGVGVTFSQLHRGSPEEFVSGAVVTLALLGLLVGAFYWLVRHAEWFAHRIVPDEETLGGEGAVSFSDVQSAAFCCVGVLLLGGAFPALLQELARLAYAKAAAGPEAAYGMVRVLPADLVGPAAQTVLGLYLFVSPRGLARLWQGLQGTRPMRGG